MVVNQALGFATTKEQKDSLIEYLKSGNIQGVHTLTKLQRYQIIRKIFANKDIPLDEKMGYLNKEMAVDFSDVDNMNKLKCLACIPDD